MRKVFAVVVFALALATVSVQAQTALFFGTPVASLDANSGGAGTNGIYFSLPSTDVVTLQWEVRFSSAPSAVNIILQASLDAVNWWLVDTTTATAGEMKMTATAARFVRVRIVSKTGGGTTTATVIAKRGGGSSAGGGAGGGLTNAELRASSVDVSIVSGGSGAGTSAVDNAVFTGGTTATTPFAALFDATPPTITDGSSGIVRMNSTRVLMVDGSSFTQPVSIASPVAVTGTFFQATQPVSGTFFQATQPVSAASLPLPAGAATSAEQTTQSSHLSRLTSSAEGIAPGTVGATTSFMVGAIYNSTPPTFTNGQRGALQFDVNGNLKTTGGAGGGGGLTNTELRAAAVDVNITGGGGSGGTSAVDNAAFTGGTTGTTPLAALYDTTPPAVTDGSSGIARMNVNRQLMVDGSGVTQPVSGTFWQATQPVSGTFFQATQPVSNAGTFATQLSQYTPVTITVLLRKVCSIEQFTDATCTPPCTQSLASFVFRARANAAKGSG